MSGLKKINVQMSGTDVAGFKQGNLDSQNAIIALQLIGIGLHEPRLCGLV
jgi:hypothetical protein